MPSVYIISFIFDYLTRENSQPENWKKFEIFDISAVSKFFFQKLYIIFIELQAPGEKYVLEEEDIVTTEYQYCCVIDKGEMKEV